MTKFALVLVILAIVSVQGDTNFPGFNDAFFEAAAAGNWEHLKSFLNSKIPPLDGTWKPIATADVKDLKPVPGGHVYGESEYTFQSSSNINGEKTEESGGHKVINDDGKVSEYDFDPTKQ